MSELHRPHAGHLAALSADQWLSPDEQDVELIGKLLVPAPSELITFHPVSTEVNNARNKGEQLIEPIELEDEGEGEGEGETV